MREDSYQCLWVGKMEGFASYWTLTMNVFGVSASSLFVEVEEDEDEDEVVQRSERRKNRRRREDIASCGLLRKRSEVWFQFRVKSIKKEKI